MEVQPLCRICRGEHTDLEPLLHPCKCKGSIKYIHQHCLMEWLKHSNKSVKKCDICNTPYQFRTIYDPKMPARIPLSSILLKLMSSIGKTVGKGISILLYIVCVCIQVPIFFKFMGRLCTWGIDGRLPPENPKFIEALLYGESTFNSISFDNPADLTFHKLRHFLDHTYSSGVIYILVYVLVHLALFVEHEWVVRDEGYTKMLMKRIGKEPKSKLADMFQDALNGLRQEARDGNANAGDVVDRIELIAHAINDLNGPNLQRRRQDELIAELQENTRRFRDVDENEAHTDVPMDAEPSNAVGAPIHHNDGDNHEDGDGDENDNDDNNNNENNDTNNNDNGNDRLQAQEEFDRMMDDVLNDGEDGEDGDENNVFAMLGLNLNMSTPILLMIMCDAVISVYLFITYLIPQSLGSALVGANAVLFQVAKTVVLERPLKLMDFLLYIFYDMVYVPTIEVFSDLLRLTQHQPSMVERTITIVTGYLFIGCIAYMVMKGLSKNQSPVVGTPRRVYSALFECFATLKVFFIFSIEIFFFPVYCGWLLDFCFAPVLLDNFQVTSHEYLVLFTSVSSYFSANYVRITLYWAYGTLYMLSFALFIGMTRNKILRPGVLFFIRSPDDPNARLIHDALVKPLGLQLSRIYLSGKVYTAFIFIGIGSVTWGLRYLLNPELLSSHKNVLLPVKLYAYGDLVISAFAVLALITNKGLISRYVEIYWKRAFELSCHKLRLSHFILGKPIPQERGYVVYRSWRDSILGTKQPDYSNPVTYKEALQMFQTTDAACFFVPNGTYIRVPDNDTVSRKYIKHLFVSVTKDDRLLSVNDIVEESVEDPEDDSNDEETTTEDNYTVVYNPPHLKVRCVELIIMLWVFAVLLIISLFLTAVVLGKPVTKAISVVTGFGDFLAVRGSSGALKSIEKFINRNNWKLADITSLSIGALMELMTLAYYHNHYVAINELDHVDVWNNLFLFNNENGGNNNGNNDRLAINVRIGRNFAIPLNAITAASTFSSALLSTLWMVNAHVFVVDVPLRIYKDIDVLPFSDFYIDRWAIAGHLLISPWTIWPNIRLFFSRDLRGVETFSFKEVLHRYDLYQNLVKFCVLISCAVFITYKMHHQTYETSDLLVAPIAFGGFVVVHSFFRLKTLFNFYDQQIKNEKYVRGRALENIDG
ncbi:hypothetical protein CANTEDRAFT_125275 [Yamadazyma tenuis ATCC 10573]|uniref:RING-type E3 ubiquitin transferase n=1 Tax=Candida tenuis (strain ATCC 10573 / BCRC 21748 / CBS 615 / JCM 9827 / NBRC 10315 / NRRL Y-1498 / VKM Y-70) TaxID=590646 RepID=G3B9M6_CANTC|nr:uncharacterized protein CANTEDRAFT_125275 [Yamadazyma tenuis ATCC 10573]EGV61927.1 hypothetical protein CANTEDRAFT_125275 [Yamadazyma tenuis ATCC 10573]